MENIDRYLRSGNIIMVIMNIYDSAKSCFKNDVEFFKVFSSELILGFKTNLIKDRDIFRR